jgi:hypothetical protein
VIVTNTLAYLAGVLGMNTESFITLTPGGSLVDGLLLRPGTNLINLFLSIIDEVL